jgi:D-psicose/D-tagatose/L-ribulose 3-epimerase
LLVEKNVKLGIEPLNRYETDFINTVDEGLKLCELIDHPNVGLLLDSYHMNIEEKNVCQSIEKAKDKLFHFQVAENDRGVPGTGSINWTAIFSTLKKINYNKNVTLEMFIQANVDTSKDLFTWRNIENDPYDAIVRSFNFLSEHLNA